jgi:2'-5' RNA ligase
LGRVRQNIDPTGLQKIRATVDTIQLGNIGSTRVDSIHLYKSELHASGSVYTKLFSATLKKQLR